MNNFNVADNDEYFDSETQYVDGRESFYNILTSDEMRKSDHEKDLTYVDGEVFADALQTIATKSKTLISRSSTSRKSTLDNNQSFTPDVCRICFQPDSIDADSCMTPCDCRGTISKVHKVCLEMWLSRSNSNVCEICGFKYNVLKSKKFSLLSSVKAWWDCSETQEDTADIVFDTLMISVILPTIASVTYFGFLVVDQILYSDRRQVNWVHGNSPVHQLLSFGIVTSTLCVNFLLFSWTTCRVLHYVSSWFTFYKTNEDVTIIDEEESPKKTS